MADDLFTREQRLAERAEAATGRTGAGARDDAALDGTAGAPSYGELAGEYRKLLKVTRRMVRLSDRNERALGEAAERQRRDAEEIERKNQALETLSAKLAKYLSPQVYASIFEGRQEVRLASTRKKLTVFFSDIVAFTELTDRLESEDLTRLLNRYLTEMAKVAMAHGATIDKFVGDAIMIFFGDPETRGVREDALACTRMAVAMQRRLRELEAEWRREGVRRPVRCRMGINTGFCTVGNFGSDDRMDYTIIGGAVNIASRLEKAAPPGEIVLSYETWAHVRDEIACEEMGQIDVRGVAYPVAVYRVASPATAPPQAFHHREPGLDLTLDAERMTPTQREDARAALAQALALLGEDQG